MSLHDQAKDVLLRFIKLNAKTADWGEVFINHSLNGFFDSDSVDWKKQYYRNLVQENVIIELSQECELKDKIIVLKGMSFGAYGIYRSWGERLTSDIDLLVDDLEYVSSVLINKGFELVQNHMWRGNSFKRVLSKNVSGIEVVIELHSRIFYHTKGISLNYKQAPNGYLVLEIEDLLLHLVGHLGFQHTFLKLHWLLDIYLILKIHSSKINWARFFKLVEAYELKQSWKFTQLFIDLVFYSKKPKGLFYKFLINPRFIIFPEKSFIRYYMLKNLLKDSFSDTMKYNCWWLLEKGWRK